MIEEKSKSGLIVLVPLTAVILLVLSWMAIGKENSIVLPAVGMVLLLLVCFFSVKISLILLILSMLLSPEISMGSTSKREITVRLDDIFLLVMTFGWMLRMAIFKDIGFVRRNPLNYPIIVYSVLMVLSTSLGAYRGYVNILSGMFFTLKLLEYFFLFNVVVNYAQHEKDIHLLTSWLLFVGGVVCVYGIFQALTGGDVAAPFEGSEGERNTLGGYLALIGAIAGGLYFKTEKGLEKSLLLLLLGGICVVLVFSMSRSGWSAFVTAGTVLFLAARRFKTFVVFVVLALLLLPTIVPEEAVERFAYTFSQGISSQRQVTLFGIRFDTSSSARLLSYLLVLERIPNHLLLGYGITGFAFIDGQFFRCLSEMGVFGLFAFLWLLVAVHNVILKTLRADIHQRINGMALGFYAGFWGLVVHALTANTFIIVRIAEPFWCCAGLTTAALLYKEQLVEETQPDAQPAHVPSRPRPLLLPGRHV